MPLYQQLADELSDQIRAGQFAPGTRIPSENVLAAHYQLGRPTVRQATEVLVRRRVLVRKRGSGTFVNEATPDVDLFSLGGTLASFRRSGLRLETKLLMKLAMRKVSPDPHNPYAGKRVYTLQRVARVDKEPVLLERFYFDPRVFVDMSKGQTDVSSLSEFVQARYGLSPRGGRQTFTVTHADADIASSLMLTPRTPLLLVRRTLDFPRAPLAVYSELFCHTDEFVFAQDIGEISHA